MGHMNKSGHHISGKFDLYYRNGFAELIVYPPEGDGLPVYPEEVTSRMKILSVPTVRLQKIVQIIEEASSLPVKLVEWPDGILLSSAITIKISDDQMSAEAIISSPKTGGGELTLKDIYGALDDLNISFGIEEKRINRVIADHFYDKPFIIAEGREAIPGRESSIEYFFETERLKPFLELKYGRINLKELNFIQNCQSGDILAELKPAEPPIDGFNILGTCFPAESTGKPAGLLCGQNCHIENDRIISDIKGNVILTEGVVEVEEVVSVNNVDYETGNIDFDGSIDISGTIADGFSVKATGDIQVGKCIGRAEVISQRNVILKAGINGDREGTISCIGNLVTKYVESSAISCGGDIIAEEAVMNSQLDIVGSLYLTGRRAELIGGLTILGGSLHCKKIGNLYDAKTNIIIGLHPQLIEQFFNTQKALGEKRKRLDTLDEKLSQMKAHHPKDKDSSSTLIKTIYKAEEAISTTSLEISAMIHKIQEMRKDLVPAEKSYILAEDRIFRGVKISFGLQDHHVPDKGISSSIVYKKGKNILEVGYNKVNPDIPEELK